MHSEHTKTTKMVSSLTFTDIIKTKQFNINTGIMHAQTDIIKAEETL